MHIEFNPNFGYKFFKIGYCTKNEFFDKFSVFSNLFRIYDNTFLLIPVNLSNLFYLSFDEKCNIWKLFHSISNKLLTREIEIWSNTLNNLDKDFVYIFEYNESIKNICVFDKKEKNIHLINQKKNIFVCINLQIYYIFLVIK
uniref:Uncharacterized protein n=1 Tax=Moumouvirus sp. 'Monve' TaxID=1128131 RepID=H2EER9_9VIRU|nr:hypothetical protein mv_L687 [Moumouvirus Monve]